ncbi:MAG: NTP transferase domain-containing protein [Prevotella sp.]|nr:NTP transferase domain-containing protein [Bacteroides sp.]MCM1366700.1 NTP transferase domain-containing protein [Prevotella sp.]
MKAMILAAGLGTRLKPWTLKHPKALVPVKGKPMLERVVDSLRYQGFDRIVVNVHHFAEQIMDFLKVKQWDDIMISDERGELLDTGGGILHAEEFLGKNDEPFLIHNVDILSDADLNDLMMCHLKSGRDCSLLVSERESSRKLIFDKSLRLKGWHSVKEDRYKPENLDLNYDDIEKSFSGIHVMSPKVFDDFRRLGLSGKFPVMDYYLNPLKGCDVGGVIAENLHLIDIGKPETLSRAQEDGLFI